MAKWELFLASLESGVGAFPERLGRKGLFGGLKLGFGKALFVFGDVVPLGDHGLDALGVFGGEVVEFGAVFGEVVEFPAAEFGGGDLPVAGTEGAVFREVEVEGIVGFAFHSFEDGEKGFSDEGVDGAATYFFGVRGSSDFEAGGHEVDEVSGLTCYSSEGCFGVWFLLCHLVKVDGVGVAHPSRSSDDEGGRNTAFVLVLFVEAEGGVAEGGPADVVAPIGFGVPRFEFFATGAVEGAGSVVGTEHDEGVVVEAFFLQILDEAADVLVEDIDHGGINFHAVFFPLFVFSGEAVPSGDVGGAGGELPFGGEEAGRDLPFVAALAEDIPAFGVFSVIFFDVGFGSLERVVGSVVGAVEEEGFWALVILDTIPV